MMLVTASLALLKWVTCQEKIEYKIVFKIAVNLHLKRQYGTFTL